MAAELAEGVLLLSITGRELVVEAKFDLAAASVYLVSLVDLCVIMTINDQRQINLDILPIRP